MATPYALTGADWYIDQAVAPQVTNHLLNENLTNPSELQDASQPHPLEQNIATKETWVDDFLVTYTSLHHAESQVENPLKRQRTDDLDTHPRDPLCETPLSQPRFSNWFSDWSPPVASSGRGIGSMPNEAEPSRGRSTSKTAPSRSGSVSSFASNVSCGSCSATFARPDVRKRHEDEKHSTETQKAVCGGTWLGWGCGKEYANERSLKDHWSRQAKDGTGKSCKAAKESVFASFPAKDDLTEQSSSHDGIVWDEHGSMNGRDTEKPTSSLDWASVTPPRRPPLRHPEFQPEQAGMSNSERSTTADVVIARIMMCPKLRSSTLRILSMRDRDLPTLEECKRKLQQAVLSWRDEIGLLSTQVLMLGAVAHINEIEAEKATLETEIGSLQERINELTLGMFLQSGLSTQDPTSSRLD